MNITKSVIVLSIFVAAFLAIGKIFWEQELKYAQPTPLPSEYTSVPVNQEIDLKIEPFQESGKPKHLHFYNPECPCSRFNLSHFSSLEKKYKEKIDFYLVIPTEEHIKEVAEQFDNNIPVIADPDKKLAKACGVYSTPQAVIIDDSGKLYYRGNYNKARYCTTVSSNYAQLAIDYLLANKPPPYFGILSSTAYGCELGEKNWFTFFSF